MSTGPALRRWPSLFDPVFELGVKLFHLGTDYVRTVGLVRILVVIILVVFLGDVELTSRLHLGHNRVAPIGCSFADRMIREALLIIGQVKDRRPVLRAHIVALLIQRRRI